MVWTIYESKLFVRVVFEDIIGANKVEAGTCIFSLNLVNIECTTVVRMIIKASLDI